MDRVKEIPVVVRGLNLLVILLQKERLTISGVIQRQDDFDCDWLN